MRARKVKPHAARYTFSDIVGGGPAINRAVGIAKKLAESTTTVFITGETGTGKELFAQAIHNASSRKRRPFIAQNIAALPEQLVQSELFGYERGAFTGALREGKHGLFELADGGTVFLDEIGDMSLSVQISLLRVLQEREVTRVGGSSIIPVDVRIIAATNQDLTGAMAEGRFRKDLYYRLCAFPLRIPPLRERLEDIASLAQHFISRYSQWKLPLSRSLLESMREHLWPGNVRELEGLIKYAASIADAPGELTEAIQKYLGTPPPEKDDTSTYAAIAARLSARGEMADFRAIMELLNSVLPSGLGRMTLCQHLSGTCSTMTVGQIKARLHTLQHFDLTKSFRGQKGTVLTPLGVRFLEYLSRYGS